jgi:hypothetical protein
MYYLHGHTNCAPYPIWIERNDLLGFEEHHTEEAKSERLDKRFIANLMQEVTISSIEQDKSLKWTSEAKLGHIQEHANINVPREYKSKRITDPETLQDCEHWKKRPGMYQVLFP